MSKLLGFLGRPHVSKEFGTIYPPTVAQVVENKGVLMFYNVITQTQEDIWDAMAIEKGERPKGERYEDAPTPFLLFLQYYYKTPEQINQGMEPFFGNRVLIPSEHAKGLLLVDPDHITSLEDVTLIDEENFLKFQNAIRDVMGEKSVEAPDPNEHPKISAFKAKARYREQIANKSKGGTITFEEMVIAVSCMHPNISPLNVGELPYPALFELFKKLNAKESYDAQVRAATSGFGGSLKGLKNWMKDDE